MATYPYGRAGVITYGRAGVITGLVLVDHVGLYLLVNRVGDAIQHLTTWNGQARLP